MMCIISYVLICLIVISFFALAFKSNMLRDSVDMDAFIAAAKALNVYKDGDDINKIPRPFSLSRTQLAVWTTVIVSSYLYLTFCTGQGLDCLSAGLKLNTTVLVLLGISVGTTVAASAIDQNQKNTQQDRHQSEPSSGFLMDIMSDENGVSIHRFQNIVWTVVCMLIYIYKVYNCQQLPDLDPTLIGLTGISNAAYVTVKIKENA